METEKNLGGRPRIFKTPEEFDNKLEEYILVGDDGQGEDHTLTGMCLYMGFCDKQSLYDYEKYDGFSCSVKKARMFIESTYEKHLKNGNAGVIFALKNFGWTDKQQIELEGNLTTKVVRLPQKKKIGEDTDISKNNAV